MRYKLLIIALLSSMMLQAQVEVARLKTASSPFRQTRVSMMLENPEVRTGNFQYTAPDKIVWKYDGQDNIALPEQMLGFIRQAVSGNLDEVNGSFDVTWEGSKAILTPKKKQIKRFFQSIEIYFTKKGVAEKVVLTEPSGDTTQIEFTKLTYTTL